jgi:hypothetical protein
MSKKIISLAIVSSVLAFSGVPAFAESIPAIEHAQISDRSVPSFGSMGSGMETSVTQQELNQYGNSAQPDVDASASRGHDASIVKMQDQQIPH